MGTTEVGNTLGGKSGTMGGIGMGVYTGMGRRQNRWIPIHIFNQSLATGTLPTKFKIAKVIPVFKSGDALDPSNYRPISLLSTFSKILEKIVHNRLFTYLDTHSLLSTQQLSFRPKHSTTHPMTLLLNQVTTALNTKKHSSFFVT